MVKLIKLNAPFTATNPLYDALAQFTAYFNEDIILKPYSKIALRNIQFSTPNVDSITAGQGLRVSLKNNINGSKNWKTILIDEKNYRNDELAMELYRLLNSGFLPTDCPLIRTGIYNRVMFDVGYTDKNVMHIDFKFMEDNYNTNLTTNENITFDNEDLTYSKTANFGQWDYISSGKLPISLCTGSLNFNINGTDDVNGCAIGIMVNLYSPDDPNTQPNDSDFYFKIYTEGGTYWYKKILEEPIDTTIPAQDQDLVNVAIQQGSFKLIITRDDETVIETQASTLIDYVGGEGENADVAGNYIDNKLEYYVFFGLKNQNSKIIDIAWTPNPYFSSNENGITKTPKPTPHVVVNSLSDAVPSTVSLDFLQGFNHQIGFNNIYYEQTGVSGSFVGDLSTTDIRLPDGFYVVLDNVRLNSYDFNTVQKVGNRNQPIGRRKNILANITSFDFLTNYNLVSYETDAPTFIDMDNKDPINLNSISVSVYDNDNNLLTIGSPDPELTTTLTKCPLKLTLLID